MIGFWGNMEATNVGETLKSFYRECDPEAYFKCIDGSTIKSIGEFAEAMEWMSEDVFYYHVSDEKNDFANWIESVFGRNDLSDMIKHARTKERIQITLLYYMLKKSLGKQ